MHGDRVVVRIARIEADGRADGEIVKVLKRAHPTVVGEFRIGRRGQYVVPQDERIQQWIEIPEGMEFPPAGRAGRPHRRGRAAGLYGRRISTAWWSTSSCSNIPEKGAAPVGRVIEILGHPDDFGVDVEIVIRKHHLPHRFPPEVVEQARSRSAAIISARELAGPPRFPRAGHRHHRRRNGARFRRCRVGGPPAQRQLRAARSHRRRQPLRAPGHAHRRGGPPARHQRLLPGPRRPHAALRAFHQHLLAQSAGGPAGAFGAARDRSPGRSGRPGVHARA